MAKSARRAAQSLKKSIGYQIFLAENSLEKRLGKARQRGHFAAPSFG
jgi:hypothetical protein